MSSSSYSALERFHYPNSPSNPRRHKCYHRSSETYSGNFDRNIKKIKSCLRGYLRRHQMREEKNLLAMEWRTLALALDRVCAIVYIMAIAIGIICLIPCQHDGTIGSRAKDHVYADPSPTGDLGALYKEQMI
ncbi:unnamed protein product [Protopolystoma xenopodis]|uniref:Neurotransmitter-gated ion-channel transmembrane domain-containing protein n=1 Tax=Protopolystoma xenopodis TaxID=117903 RepID=A0A448X006_9PLAT|nr:unnamed protein product [Protopolystoma xenopodis]